MRIIVTGACGFIGGHLTDKLVSLGHDVLGLDNFSTGKYQNQQANYVRIDIGNCSINGLLDLLDGADCVIHLAARARVQPSFDDPIGYNRTNVTGTLNVLEACRRLGIKNFIFASSSSVYGEQLLLHPSKEENKLNPTSPYAFQKVVGEEYCNFYSADFGMNCKILRFFNVYGDRMIPNGQYQQAIRIFLDNYKKNEPFRIFGDGEQRRDFTHVGDIVDGIVLAMNWQGSDTFNLGNGKNFSVNELCEMIGGKNYVADYLPGKNEPRATLADNQKAKDILGWQPKKNLPDWIQEQITYM